MPSPRRIPSRQFWRASLARVADRPELFGCRHPGPSSHARPPGPVQLGAIAATESEQPVEAARRLATRAGELALETERGRRLAPELVSALADAGLFRLCVPAALGGLEASPAVLIECVEALARGDGSAGWCVAIAATSGLLAGYLPEDGAREIYSPPRSIVGGVFAPRGQAVPSAGGFQVSGRWPFASGCEHCEWLMGGCVVRDESGIRKLPGGMPDVRLMLAPAAQVRIHDTWHVSGLRGTGSHDIEFDELSIPAEHSASVFTRSAVAAWAPVRVPAVWAAGGRDRRCQPRDRTCVAGRARVAGTGEDPDRQQPPPRGSSHRPRGRRSRRGRVQAARVLLLDAARSAFAIAAQRGEVPQSERVVLRLASTHAATTAAEVAGSAYRNGGGSAIYDSSPLQRQFRDANVATQHVLVGPPTWELTGRLLLGVETDTAQL